MLLRVDQTSHTATRAQGTSLKHFGLAERDLQDILFKTLDRLIGEDELLLLMQSRNWQEEPDLMALDRNGKLYIFEIKLWESNQQNILQVLRYGQLNGALDYDGLNEIWKRSGADHELDEAHKAKFDVELAHEKFNKRQTFIVLTNGLDVGTRRAIQYWRTTGLEVRPWIYRSYDIEGQMLLEIIPFRTVDDPLEDQAEGVGDGYYIFNTNFRNDKSDDDSMINNKRVAAFFAPWKFKVDRLKRGDHIFLYRSGSGIVAVGKSDGKLKKASYHNKIEYKNEEHSMGLTQFMLLANPISAAEIKSITASPVLIFRQTMFSLDQKAGERLFIASQERAKA